VLLLDLAFKQYGPLPVVILPPMRNAVALLRLIIGCA
jgi:hypothetical protein